MNNTPIIQENKETKEKNLKVLISASIVGGILTSFLVTPLDVVKTRLQTQTQPDKNLIPSNQYNKHIFKGTLDAFKKIYKNEGIFTFWRGLTPSLLMTVPNTTIYFTSYESIKEKLYQFSDNESYQIYTVPFIAGTAARMVSASVTSPLELLRTNSQGINLELYRQQQQKQSQINNSTINMKTNTTAQHQQQRFNSITLFRDIIKNVGIKGLWRGYFPTLVRDVPFSTIYWVGFSAVQNKLMKIQDPSFSVRTSTSSFYINFLSGFTSGTIAAILTTPIDVIKTKIQITVQKQQQHIVENNLNGMVYQFKQIVKEEGWKGLFRGIVPRITKVGPGCAIMISTFEWIKQSKF